MENSKSNFSRITNNTIILYMKSFIVLMISLYTSRVIFNVFGIVDYGIYNVTASFLSLMTFLNNSMILSYQRFYTYEIGRNNTKNLFILFKSSLTIQLLLATFVFIILVTIGFWLFENKLEIPDDRITAAKIVYHLSVWSFALTFLIAPFNALIIAYEKMYIFAYINILDSVLKLITVFILPSIIGDKMILYTIILLLISIIDLFLYFIICKNKFLKSCSIVPIINKNKLKDLLSFSGWGTLDSLSYVLKSQGINILLNIFFGPVVNAARGIAMQIFNAVNMFVMNFQTSFRPQIIKSYAKGDYQYMYKFYYTTTKISLYLMWIITLPCLLETKNILHLWLGDEIPAYSVAFTRLLLLTGLVSAYANPTSCIANATGNIKWINIWASGFNCLIIPIAYLFLVDGFGPSSTMIVSLVITIIVQITRLIVLRMQIHFPIGVYLRKVIIPTFSVMLASIITTTFIGSNIFEGILQILLSVIYTLLLVPILSWFIGLNNDEKVFVKDKLKLFRNIVMNKIQSKNLTP